MADIRSSQNIAQVEWDVPGKIKSFQNIAQVEWTALNRIKSSQNLAQVEWVLGGWAGKINTITNPAKISGIAAANIGKVTGVS